MSTGRWGRERRSRDRRGNSREKRRYRHIRDQSQATCRRVPISSAGWPKLPSSGAPYSALSAADGCGSSEWAPAWLGVLLARCFATRRRRPERGTAGRTAPVCLSVRLPSPQVQRRVWLIACDRSEASHCSVRSGEATLNHRRRCG